MRSNLAARHTLILYNTFFHSFKKNLILHDEVHI